MPIDATHALATATSTLEDGSIACSAWALNATISSCQCGKTRSHCRVDSYEGSCRSSPTASRPVDRPFISWLRMAASLTAKLSRRPVAQWGASSLSAAPTLWRTAVWENTAFLSVSWRGSGAPIGALLAILQPPRLHHCSHMNEA